MSGIFLGPIEDDLDIRRSGIGAFRTTTGDVHAATFGQALQDSIVARGYRWLADEFSELERGHGARTGRPSDKFDDVILSAEEATKRGKDVGLTPITAPISEASLQALMDARQERNAREDRINRREGGILTGGVARFITGTGAGLLDPFQVAAGFLPIAPAAKVAAALFAAGGAGGRAGVRAAVGAAQGAAGTALLEPFVYASDQREHNDWTMGNAAMNIALGAAVGGVVMPVVGRFSAAERAFRDRPATIATRPGIVEHPPDTREPVLRAAIDDVVEGRAVTSMPMIDAMDLWRAAEGAQDRAASVSAMIAGWGTMPRAAAAPDAAAGNAQISIEGRAYTPPSMLEFIGSRGGVMDQGGDLLAIGANAHFVPGQGRIVRKAGMTLDYAREAAEEAGYLRPGSTIADFLDAVAEEVSGRKVYLPHEYALAHERKLARMSDWEAERVEEYRLEIQDVADEFGITLRPGEMDHALMMRMDGAHPDEAIRDATMGRNYRDVVDSMWDDADDAMRTMASAADADNARIRELSAEREALTERAPRFDGDTNAELSAISKEIEGMEARMKLDIDNHPQSAAIKRSMDAMDAWVAEQNAIADGYPTIASIACRNTGGPG